ncbi:MAG: DJ-1/PfpI family protein [Lentisphaerae bacterium]|nr:DJ-1/PfpI family protein [Lentisphaerota bacterium]
MKFPLESSKIDHYSMKNEQCYRNIGAKNMKKVLLILADGFEEIEALGTADVLRRLGVEVVLAGLGGEFAAGAHAMKIAVDVPLAQVTGDDFDAVILPGGMPGSANLDKDPDVDRLLKQFALENKLIAAICAAPFVLAKRGLLDGKVFTMYPGFDHELGGLRYTSNPAEVSGNTVTGKGPGAVFAFARAVAEKLGLGSECAELYKGMFIE